QNIPAKYVEQSRAQDFMGAGTRRLRRTESPASPTGGRVPRQRQSSGKVALQMDTSSRSTTRPAGEGHRGTRFDIFAARQGSRHAQFSTQHLKNLPIPFCAFRPYFGLEMLPKIRGDPIVIKESIVHIEQENFVGDRHFRLPSPPDTDKHPG